MKWRFWSVMGISALHVMIMAGCGSNGGGSSSASVTVAAASCISCHDPVISPVTGLNIVTEWQASTHSTQNAASCYDCHEPDPTHPSKCNQCHGGGTLSTDSARHDVVSNPDSSQKCYKCHGLSFPNDVMIRLAPQHFGNLTASSGNTTYRAQYVSSQYVGKCRKCHNPHNPSGAMAKATEWAESGHGETTASPWAKYEFKTRGTTSANPATSVATQCVRCHTTTGYINFVTTSFRNISAWGTSSDKTKQVLACNACHDDGNGNSYNWNKRRTVPSVIGYYNYSSFSTKKLLVNYAFPDVSTSNICMACHVGRESGDTLVAIEAAGGNFSNLSFVNSHYLTAGATIFRASGYEYSGRDYDDPSTYLHRYIGIGNLNNTGSDGPCVTCHMRPARHTYLPVVTDGNADRLLAVIQQVVSPVCANCHSGGWSAAALEAKKGGFRDALNALKDRLAAKGHPYPFSSSVKDWETIPTRGYGVGTGVKTMGAAFNYYLLSHDYGAFAHNSIYTKRLIYDSIDWIYDGVLDDDVETAIDATALTAAQKENAINYLMGARVAAGGQRP